MGASGGFMHLWEAIPILYHGLVDAVQELVKALRGS